MPSFVWSYPEPLNRRRKFLKAVRAAATVKKGGLLCDAPINAAEACDCAGSFCRVQGLSSALGLFTMIPHDNPGRGGRQKRRWYPALGTTPRLNRRSGDPIGRWVGWVVRFFQKGQISRIGRCGGFICGPGGHIEPEMAANRPILGIWRPKPRIGSPLDYGVL